MESVLPSSSTQPRRTWPWFVLLFLMLGVVLAVVWMSAEVRRAKERRAYIIPESSTTSAPAPTH